MANGREVKQEGTTKKFGKVLISPLARFSPGKWVLSNVEKYKEAAEVITAVLHTIS